MIIYSALITLTALVVGLIFSYDAGAQITSPNFWQLRGTTLSPLQNNWNVSSTALKVGNNTTTTNLTISGISGSTQCLQANTLGIVSGSGSGCGGGSLSGGSPSALTLWASDTGVTYDSNLYYATGSDILFFLNASGSTLNILHGTTTNFYISNKSFLGNASATNISASGFLNVTGRTDLGIASTENLTVGGVLGVTGRADLTSVSSTWLTVTNTGQFNSVTTSNLSFGSATGSSLTLSGNATTAQLTITGIASGNCLQTGTGGLVTSAGAACGTGGVNPWAFNTGFVYLATTTALV